MPPSKTSTWLARLVALLPLPALADLTVDVGLHVAAEGETALQVPVPVVGGDPVSEMVAIVQVGEGGPLVGGSPAPEVTTVSLAGSVWEAAPGGSAMFFPSVAPPSEITDPNVALQQAGETVTATGLLMTLTIDTTGFPPGDYPIHLANTAGGDTVLSASGAPVPATFISGTLRITSALEAWRFNTFGPAVDDPGLESTLHGDCADPDLDGYDNITEFHMGTPALVFTTAPATGSATGVPRAVDQGSTNPKLTESRHIDQPVTASLEVSDDMVSWSPVSSRYTIESTTPIPGGTHELVTWRRTAAPADGREFFRLKVTKP